MKIKLVMNAFVMLFTPPQYDKIKADSEISFI